MDEDPHGEDETEEESEESYGDERAAAAAVELRPAAPDWKQAFDSLADPTAAATSSVVPPPWLQVGEASASASAPSPARDVGGGRPAHRVHQAASDGSL